MFVVVLVVPTNDQLIEPLGVINRLLSYRSGDLLPVATKLRAKAAARPNAPQDTADTNDVDDILEAATTWRPEDGNGRRPTAAAAAGSRVAAPPAEPPMPASPRLGAPPAPRRRVAFTPLEDPVEPVDLSAELGRKKFQLQKTLSP